MHNNYKIDEKIIKDIIKSNTKCTDSTTSLQLTIYYRNRRAHNLVMKNNNSSQTSPLLQKNLVYAFKCPMPHSKVAAYIGYTECTLQKRIQAHFYSGSIKEHFIQEHNIKPTKEQISDNTTIVATGHDKIRLTIKEALLILKHAPTINRQFDNFNNTLKLHKTRVNTEPTFPQDYNNNNVADVSTADDAATGSTLLEEPISQLDNSVSPSNNRISPNILRRINNLIEVTQSTYSQQSNTSLNSYNLRSRTLNQSFNM